MAFKVCCSCGEANITIRRYDTSTGETLWEYGPGEGWTPHYNSDLITGWYVPANTVLNKRVQSSIGGGTWIRPGLTEFIRPRATLNAVWTNRTVTNINENILQPVAGDGNVCSPVLPMSGAPDTQSQQWTLRNFLQTGSITSVTLWMRVRFDSNSDGTISSARVRLNGTWHTGSVVNLPGSGAWGWASMTITTAFGTTGISTLPAFEITAGLTTADATLELDTVYLEARIVGASPGLSPNAAEALHWVTLNAEDGSVESDIVVPGAFVTGTAKGNYRPTDFPIELFGLSGGNIVTSGGPPPVLELVDFDDNNATKYYTLHGHSYKIGNVTLTTVGNVACVFAVTASNATIEATIDALTEVSSVTVTGGPWPHKAVELTIVWTVFSGDFKGFSVDNTSGGKLTRAGATLFDAETGEIIGSINQQSFGFGTGVTASKLISSGYDDVPTVTSAPSTAINTIIGACGSNAILLATLGTLENWTPGETWTRNWVIWLNVPNSTDDITPTFSGVSNIENETVLISYACTNNEGVVDILSPESGKYSTFGKYGTFVTTSSGSVSDLPSANYGDGAILHTLGYRSSWAAKLADGDSENPLCIYGPSSLRNIAYFGTTVDQTNANLDQDDNYAITAGHTITLELLPTIVHPDPRPHLFDNNEDYANLFCRVANLYAAASDRMLVGRNVDTTPSDDMVMRWLGRTENVETPNLLLPWFRTYRRYWWAYQVRNAIRAVSGEFRIKIKWTFSPDSFIYTNWMSYTSTTETELEDELTETLGPPGSNYNRTPPFGNFPIVSVQPLMGAQYNDWGIGNEIDPDRNWYSILERGILVVYTTDRFGTEDIDSDTYIPSEKSSTFSNQANIVFEFRNMVWPEGYDDTLQMVERTSAADLIWSRKWIPRPKAPNRAFGSWIKDGRTIHYNTESRAELPQP
jgi:hypothetical protein